ncbi:MAG TPA: ABC transporter permease, partial [Thermoanaerobaculia bacterium]|nr:ABC transporter permease [Thermoanaerobaculia bacterium]
MKARLETYLLPLGVAVLFVIGWHFAVKWSGSDIFPTPEMVVTGTVELARKGVLLKYVIASLFRVASGYLLAVFVGIPLGLVLGW